MLLGVLGRVLYGFLVTVALVAVGVLVYLSRPDRGGIDRCEEIFGFDSLSDRGLRWLPLGRWEPFEAPKFRMEIDVNKSNELFKYIADRGYVTWIEGGVQFGSVNIGWDASDEVYYSMKEVDGYNHFLVHDRRNNILYAIESR